MALACLVTQAHRVTVVLASQAIPVNRVGRAGLVTVALAVTPAFPAGPVIVVHLAIQVILATVAQAAGQVGQVYLAILVFRVGLAGPDNLVLAA